MTTISREKNTLHFPPLVKYTTHISCENLEHPPDMKYVLYTRNFSAWSKAARNVLTNTFSSNQIVCPIPAINFCRLRQKLSLFNICKKMFLHVGWTGNWIIFFLNHLSLGKVYDSWIRMEAAEKASWDLANICFRKLKESYLCSSLKRNKIS